MGDNHVWPSNDLDQLRIVLYPDPMLRERCRPVTEFGPALAALATRMLELMRAGKGVGLAAPQLGIPIRLFVCNPTPDPANDRVCVNPELTDLEGSAEGNEGCLSLPEITVPMRRAWSATLTGCDALGHSFRVTGVDLEARVWQHENAHLDGRLIIDNMPTSADLANRRILEQLRHKHRSHKKKRATVR